MSAEVVAILAREFPEVGEETVERVLQEHGNDIRATREALLALTSPQGTTRRTRLFAEDQTEGQDEGWLSWLGLSGTSGLNDFSAGVSKLGANLSLGLRQAAHAMAPYIPDEINPFVDDEEYEELVDEEEERQRRKDTDASVVVSASANKMQKRGLVASPKHPREGAGSPRQGLSEDEDLSPEESKKWE